MARASSMSALFALTLLGLPISAMGAEARLSPITRVVDLMKNLQEKIEEEMKTEKGLFKKFDCWAKTIIEEKTESNEKANARIKELDVYIKDIDAGRIEFTDERSTLEKELKDVKQTLKESKADHEQDTKDYEAAQTEMTQAIAALEAAVDVLGKKAPAKAAFLAVQTDLSMSATLAQGAALERAIAIGHRVLSKGDAVFMERILSGEGATEAALVQVTKPKEATFKKKYKARSGKIQDILKNLLEDFKDRKEQSKEDYNDRKDEYNSLKDAKTQQKDDLEKALGDASGETAARNSEKSQATDEKENLEEQVKNDKKYIKQAEDALEEKNKQWEARKKIQNGELQALAEATKVLYSDDARDQFNRAGTFVQVRSTSTRRGQLLRQRAQAASQVLTARFGSKRMQQLARELQSAAGPDVSTSAASGKMKEVVKSIQDLVDTLAQDQEDDDNMRQTCQDDNAAKTRKIKEISIKMDDLTDDIRTLQKSIEDKEKKIADNEAKIQQNEKELADATTQRDEEERAFINGKHEDTAARKLVKQAKKIIQDFYDNINSAGTSLLQSKKPGEAPPPPPMTFAEPYEGKQQESGGIMMMFTTIIDEIESDIKDAEEEEDEAKEDFAKLKEDIETTISDLEDANSALTEAKGKDETDKADRTSDRNEQQDAWDAKMEEIKEMRPDCDFMMINYEERKTNRNTESDSLKTAKAILSGADPKKSKK